MLLNPLSIVHVGVDYSPVTIVDDIFLPELPAGLNVCSIKLQKKPVEPSPLTVHTLAELREQATRIKVAQPNMMNQYKLYAQAGLGKSLIFPGALYQQMRGLVLVIQPNDVLVASSHDASKFITDAPTAAVYSDAVAMGKRGGVVFISAQMFLQKMATTGGLRSSVRAVICDESHHDDGVCNALKSLLTRLTGVTVVYLTATDGTRVTTSDVDTRIERVDCSLSSASEIIEFFSSNREHPNVLTNQRTGFSRSIVFLPDVTEHQQMMDFFRDNKVPCVSIHRGMTAAAARDAVDALRGKRYAIVSDDTGSSGLNFDVEVVIDTVVKKQIAYDASSGVISIETVPVRSFENDQRRWRLGRFGEDGIYFGPSRHSTVALSVPQLVDDAVIHQSYLRIFDIYERDRPWSDYVGDIPTHVMRSCMTRGFIGLLPLYLVSKFGLSEIVHESLQTVGCDSPVFDDYQVDGSSLLEFARHARHDEFAFGWIDRLFDGKPRVLVKLREPVESSGSTGAASQFEVRHRAVSAPVPHKDADGDARQSTRSSSSRSGRTSMSVADCFSDSDKASSVTDIVSLIESGERDSIVSDVMAASDHDKLALFKPYGFVPAEVVSSTYRDRGHFEHDDVTYGSVGSEFFPVHDNRIQSNSTVALMHNALTAVYKSYNPFDANHVPNLAHTVAEGMLSHIEYTSEFTDEDVAVINGVAKHGRFDIDKFDESCGFDSLDLLFGCVVRGRNATMRAIYKLASGGITDKVSRDLSVLMRDLRTFRRVYDTYLRALPRYRLCYRSLFAKMSVSRQSLR